MSAATRRGHIARAAIDAIAHRTADIVERMDAAVDPAAAALRVDGGLTNSSLLVQRVADLTGRRVEVAAEAESTALGTALLAAIGAGRMTEREAIAASATDRTVKPRLDDVRRRAERADWTSFVRGAIALGSASAPPS
jgi:glycerol kinase